MSGPEKLFRKLNQKKVQYLIVGGLAVNLHGFYRTTEDVDIVLLLEDGNLAKFLEVAKAMKLKPRVPVDINDFAKKECRRQWMREKNMKAFCLYTGEHWQKVLDVVIDYPVDFKEAYKNKVIKKDGDLRVPVISISDLIAMKKEANRERDKLDIKALEQIQRMNRETK